MAETLRDSVSVLAQAQADWIKAVVGSKSFLRNAAPPPAAAVDDDDEDDDNDDDVEEEEDGSSSRESQFLQFGISIATLINNAIEKLGSKSGTSAKAGGFDLKSLLDWRRAAPKPAEELASVDEKPSAANLSDLLKQLPVAVTAKLVEVRSMLTPEEQNRLAPLLLAIPPSELPSVIEELKSRSVDQIVVLVRDTLGTMAKA